MKAVDHMDTPTRPQLEHQAKFQIGDRVYYTGGTVWTVSARYWSRSNQRIEYDIDREGHRQRVGERFIFAATPKH